MGKSGKKDKAGKDKKDKKEKREKKEKRRKDKEKRGGKQRRRSASPSDSSGSSGSDAPRLDVNRQLQMGRAAARAVREVLAYNGALRAELRELVRQLDGGGALDVSGIPDAFLRARLLTLLDNLAQLRRNSAGQYFVRQGGASVLSFVAPLLEETEDQLAPYRAASRQHAADQKAAEAAAEGQRQQEPAATQQEQQDGEQTDAAAMAGAAAGPTALPQGDQREGLVSDSDDNADDAGAAAVGPIGPAAPPPGVLVGAGPGSGDESGQDEEEEEEDAAAAGRRVAGPAMPPAEWLAAAAQVEYPVSEEEEHEEEDDDFSIGPPPPEVAEEVDLASMDERSAEVARVLRVLAAHAAAHEKSTAAQAAEAPPDAYEVLGLEPDAAAGEVKKRYWRLSLLIHPDKCAHPRAHDAFQAVTGAAKELQDAALRKKVDERRAEAELRREFAAAAAVAERERQWRVARGEATAEDLAGPAAGPGGPARDSWMTELPPERQLGSAPAMPTGPFSGFSQKGIQARGDTSAWTMTPQQRALQLEGGAAAGPLMLAAAGAGGADAGVAAASPAQAARMAAAVDAFNAQTRKKSLLEAHAERHARGGKERKGKRHKGDKGGAPDPGYDPTQHPWRPFDREKDLGPGLGARQSAAELLKGQRALGAKFGGGQSGSRTFL